LQLRFDTKSQTAMEAVMSTTTAHPHSPTSDFPWERLGEVLAKDWWLLSTGTWTHDFPIMATTAKELGLPISTDMPNDVLELMKLYPQPTRQQGAGGVEYLPVPRQRNNSDAPSRRAA
jgi:hypothetical protein